MEPAVSDLGCDGVRTFVCPNTLPRRARPVVASIAVAAIHRSGGRHGHELARLMALPDQ